MIKRKNGLLQESVVINGKRRYFYGRTKTEVLQKVAAFHEQEEKGPLFDDIINEWWDLHQNKVAPNTLKSYSPAVARAKERFAGVRIRDITTADIQRHINDVGRKYPSLKVSQTQRLIYNLCFKYARKAGCIAISPVADIECQGEKKKRPVPAQASLDAIKAGLDAPFGLFPYLILYTGLRRGEALALTAKDIDFDNDRISVSKSVYYLNNKPYIKKPKTDAGFRIVPLLAPLKEPLKKHCQEHKGNLFCDENGNLLPEYKVRDLLIAYRKATGTEFTPHQLRHAYATVILFENGIAAKDAQSLLGHAQISTTLDIYTEFRETRVDAITQQLNSKL